MFIDVGQVRIHVRERGSGTPLVLTHGLGSRLDYWEPLASRFAEHHRTISWDLRGFGRSDKPRGPYDIGTWAEDLAWMLDVLRTGPVHLVGLSLGGVVAQRFALDFPTRVRSLVLVSTSSEVGPRATETWERLADRVESQGFRGGVLDASRSVSPACAERSPELLRELEEDTARNEPHAYAAAARAVSRYNWTAELRSVHAPTLVLQGLDDRLTPPGGAVRLARALPSARLLLVPAAGHNLPRERPDLFTCTVLAFTGAVDLA